MESEQTPLQTALADFEDAENFVIKTHLDSLIRLKNRQNLVETFEEYFEESVYCILASGFRAEIAASLVDPLVSCKGDFSEMEKIFRNKNKLRAIEKTYKFKDEWPVLREKLLSCKTVEDVYSLKLPFIGKIIANHLSRNIGLLPNSSKPDVHMIRYVSQINWGNGDEAAVKELCEQIGATKDLSPGIVDFIFWIWLSHEKGQKSDKKCCIKQFILR